MQRVAPVHFWGINVSMGRVWFWDEAVTPSVVLTFLAASSW